MSAHAESASWFAEARFGLFVHYGVYSLLGRGEWVMNRERIPREEYRALAGRFTAERFDAGAICDLAKEAGARYVVLTTMHHDGFRLYDTKLSDFNAARSAAGRDLVAEFVGAARQRGLRVGLYHSLNNWMDEPDAVAALESSSACDALIEATFERIRELVTRFNPIDLLWYDGWWPFDARRWQAERMNAMVRKIQPWILFNGRNGLAGDFATPENQLLPPRPWRPWEACMTHNASWGYHQGDEDWKSPAQIIDLLAACAAGRGNLLLNVGPAPSGAVPEPSRSALQATGRWLGQFGEAVFETDLFTFDLHRREGHRGDWLHHGPVTAKGNSLYLFIRRRPQGKLVFGGLRANVLAVSLAGAAGRPLRFEQNGERVEIDALSNDDYRSLCPVVKVTCDRAPELYLTGGLHIPTVPHPHYDPIPTSEPALP